LNAETIGLVMSLAKPHKANKLVIRTNGRIGVFFNMF
jgi:hypothetical protein